MSREKYILTTEEYKLFDSIHPENKRDGFEVNKDDLSITAEDVNSVLFSIDDEILMFGLEPDYIPNDYGKALYKLYDKIYFDDNPLEVE